MKIEYVHAAVLCGILLGAVAGGVLFDALIGVGAAMAFLRGLTLAAEATA